jgi:hypothetical protein
VTQVINTPRPGRAAIHDQIATIEDMEDVKRILRNLANTVKFHEDDADASGQESLMLSSDVPIDAGTVARNNVPLTVSYALIPGGVPPLNPDNPAPLGLVMGGMINHALDGDLVPPVSVSTTGPPQPQLIPILRGFPNYAFNPLVGHTQLDAPVYGNQIPNQEILFQMKIGDKIKYGRIPLLDTHDVAVPRPLIGFANTTGVADQVNALLQMHNDLVQSLITMGVFRMTPRAADVIDFEPGGPH